MTRSTPRALHDAAAGMLACSEQHKTTVVSAEAMTVVVACTQFVAATAGAPFLREEEDRKHPVVVLSHGVAGNRNMYSMIATDLAMHGAGDCSQLFTHTRVTFVSRASYHSHRLSHVCDSLRRSGDRSRARGRIRQPVGDPNERCPGDAAP